MQPEKQTGATQHGARRASPLRWAVHGSAAMLAALSVAACGAERPAAVGEPTTATEQQPRPVTGKPTAPSSIAVNPPAPPETTTTTEASRTEFGTIGTVTLGASCADLLEVGANHTPMFDQGVAFATVPGEAILLWGYGGADSSQHYFTLLANGAVVGPIHHSDPDGAPWVQLIDEAFANHSPGAYVEASGNEFLCTEEFQIGTVPGA